MMLGGLWHGANWTLRRPGHVRHRRSCSCSTRPDAERWERLPVVWQRNVTFVLMTLAGGCLPRRDASATARPLVRALWPASAPASRRAVDARGRRAARRWSCCGILDHARCAPNSLELSLERPAGAAPGRAGRRHRDGAGALMNYSSRFLYSPVLTPCEPSRSPSARCWRWWWPSTPWAMDRRARRGRRAGGRRRARPGRRGAGLSQRGRAPLPARSPGHHSAAPDRRCRPSRAMQIAGLLVGAIRRRVLTTSECRPRRSRTSSGCGDPAPARTRFPTRAIFSSIPGSSMPR